MTNEAAASPAPPSVRILNRRHLFLLTAAVAVMSAVIFLYRERAVEVQLTSPVYEEIESTVSANGTVIPLDDFPGRATFSGIVDKLYVRLGEHVRPGQMLARMRDQYATSRLATARAALKTAELEDKNVRMNGSKDDRITVTSDLERAQAEQASAAKALSTLRQLQRVGSASDAEVSTAAQRLETANAAVEAAKERSQSRYRPEDLQNVEAKIAADKASVAAERVSYNNANIASPIEGTVYLIPVKQYDFVQMGADLLHVADLKKLAVQANFFEPDIKELSVGEPVRITWIGAPGQVWHGKVQTKPIAVTGEGVLRSGQCTILLTDGAQGLPVNTSVTVIAVSTRHAHALTLPREAVHMEGSNHFVFRVDGSRLRKTPVQVGLVSALRIEVTSGLRPGDKVAIRAVNGGRLRNGMRIKPEGNS